MSGGDFPMVLTAEELCEYARVSWPLVRDEWIPAGLPHQRVGDGKRAKYLFRRDLFDRWQIEQMTGEAPASLRPLAAVR